jgi:hypothetical protein
MRICYKMNDSSIKSNNYNIFRTSLQSSVYSKIAPSEMHSDASFFPKEKMQSFLISPIHIKPILQYNKDDSQQLKNYSDRGSIEFYKNRENIFQDTAKISAIHTNRPSRHISKKRSTVRFNPSNNETIFINGKDFYKNNNIKNQIWWSANELALIREIFINEIKKMNSLYPKLSTRECIFELFTRSISV